MAAPVLSLTDGTTTIQLNSGDYMTTGVELGIASPGLPDNSAINDSINLVISGSSESVVQSNARAIETMLDGARRRAVYGVGPRVYLQAQIGGDSGLWRSELLFDVAKPAEASRLSLPAAIDQLWRTKVDAVLLTARRPYWEDATERAIQLSAQGQSASTSARTVQNNGVDNWLQIDSAQITGSAPAPARLLLTNTSGASRTYRDLFVGNNAYVNPGSFGNVIQGEAAASGGSNVSGSSWSAGSARSFSVSTSTITGQWTLPSAMMAAGGRFFRIFVRSGNPPSGMKITPYIYDNSGLIKLWGDSKNEVIINDGVSSWTLNDLGAIPIPPGGYDSTYAQVRLQLSMRASVSGTFVLDYINLIGLDSFRHIKQVGLDIGNNEQIEIDDIEGRYTYIASSVKHPIHIPLEQPLKVYPGVTQRLHVLSRPDSDTTAINWTMGAQMFYRPRRLSL